MRYAFLSSLALTLFPSGLEAATMRSSTYDTGVPLVVGGHTPCVVVYPDGEAGGRGLAVRIADAIAGLGAADVPVIADTEAAAGRCQDIAERLRDKTLILLGDVNTNQAIFPLYANYYCYCDARYPGARGYVLRTIVRPFGRRVNYLLIGGSTMEGVGAGVEALLKHISALQRGGDVRLPYTLQVELGEEMKALFAPALAEAEAALPVVSVADKGMYGHHRDEFMRNAHLYFLTGRQRFAERARIYALFLAEYEPERPAIRIGDYSMENLAAAWRRVRPSPIFTPEDRQKIDTRMYGTVVEQEKSWWRQHDASKGIGMRHHTTGTLAWWTLIRVLLELGEPDEDAREQLTRWRGEAEAYLDGLLRHYWDDADDYQSADSIQNTASYALQSGQLWWFEKGLARRAAQRLLTAIDNLGWYVGIQGYGEALPGWERFELNGGLLLGSCAFVYQDGGFRWLLERFPGLRRSWGSLQPWGLHQYDTGSRLRSDPPVWMQGMQVVRFTPYRLGLINSGDFLTTDIMDNFRLTGLKARDLAENLAFDKLVIRGGHQPGDAYLLLQGMSAITLSTIDMNSIIRYTDQGTLWLVHNTARRSLFFKNAVYVSRGLNDDPIPAACELVAHHDFGDLALAASRLPDCRGTTWTRNLIARKNGFAVVIDQVRADAAGQYTVCCTWRTPGFASLGQSGWWSQQGEVEFFILPGEMQGTISNRAAEPDGATRPAVLRENRSFDARAGGSVFYENLLYTAGPDRRLRCEVRRIAPGAIVVKEQREDREPALTLVAAGDAGVRLGDLDSDAKVAFVTAQGVCMVGGRTVTLAGRKLEAADGRIVFDDTTAEAARRFLDSAWRTAAEPDGREPPTPPTATGTAPPPAWTARGVGTGGGLIDGVRFVGGKHVNGSDLLATDWILPVLRAEPRLSQVRSATLDPEPTSARIAEAAKNRNDEPLLSPLQGCEFTLELAEPANIGELALLGDPFGETSQPMPDARIDLELTFTSDGFQRDNRTKTVRLTREPSHHNLYKGHSYAFECYRAAELTETANAIRVRVRHATIPQMSLSDVRLRAADAGRPQPLNVRPVDLDNDRRDEVLAWSNDGGLAVFRFDGSEVWRKRIAEGIISVDAWDLEDDGRKEIFVSRTDRQVVVFNGDGSTQWQKDFREMYRETDEKYYGDGSLVYGMAAWKPGDTGPKEVLLTSYWFSARLDTAGNVKECFRRGGHFTQIRAVPESLPGAGNLAIRSDIPWVGPVPLQWWDAKTGQLAAESSVPNGPAVFFEVGDFDADRHPDALVATEQGIGLFAAAEPTTKWEHVTDAPPVGVGVIQANGEPALVAYGREDGYLFVVGADGRVRRSTSLGEPLTCLTAVRSGAGDADILVGTRRELRCLKWEDFSECWRRPGSYQRLDVLKTPEKLRLLAVTIDGQLEAFDM